MWINPKYKNKKIQEIIARKEIQRMKMQYQITDAEMQKYKCTSKGNADNVV